jgi:CRP-like cAMP-binding protein
MAAHLSANWIDVLGYLGVVLVLGTYSMTTMIPLRIIGLCANCAFILYGYFASVYPQLLLHGLLLPLNSLRLYQMLQLIEKVKIASQGDLNMSWLKPFMSKRVCKADEVLFRKGEPADTLLYTVSGKYRLTEVAADVGPGELVGELGLVAPGNRRTLSFKCLEDGEVLTISYAAVKQLYFQNPEFGFYFLQLISQRLFQDVARLEERVQKEAV